MGFRPPLQSSQPSSLLIFALDSRYTSTHKVEKRGENIGQRAFIGLSPFRKPGGPQGKRKGKRGGKGGGIDAKEEGYWISCLCIS